MRRGTAASRRGASIRAEFVIVGGSDGCRSVELHVPDFFLRLPACSLLACLARGVMILPTDGRARASAVPFDPRRLEHDKTALPCFHALPAALQAGHVTATSLPRHDHVTATSRPRDAHIAAM